MSPRAFHVLAKPAGPGCNLKCEYCFYIEKERLFPAGDRYRMSDPVLESFTRQYIESQDAPEVTFAWQGGEPTLLGVDFFRRAVELQKKYTVSGRKINNAFQTNGTLLDDEWGAFLKENGFLVGLSIDGPAEMHDHYRVDRGGKPTFERVRRGLDLLQKHGVEFNTLTVVHNYNAKRGPKLYRFLKECGVRFMQFIPLVERAGSGPGLAPPYTAGDSPSAVTRWSVNPGDYGEFLASIFDEWIKRDVGEVFVQQFDVSLGAWMGLPSALCVYGETCGRALAIEHNGDLYPCDHYVYPELRLGNIMETPLDRLVDLPAQVRFGEDKRDGLGRECRECRWLFACRGGCPKHRFRRTADGEPGLNYLCPGLRRFFEHADGSMHAMAALVGSGRPASDIMGRL